LHKYLFTFLIIIISNSSFAQQLSYCYTDVLHNLEKLTGRGRVLYLAAHPDDENTRLISYLVNEKKYRTAYLSLTRGDGGQNLIGKEQGDALGLIRTQELLAARRIDGAEQYFTRAYDFGYSKNPEETLNFWQKDSLLSDMVFVIRYFQPDIIICRFPTTGEGGHGHHTASAILAEEAIKLAADPNAFIWQKSSASAWQTKSLYWNTFSWADSKDKHLNELKIDVGNYNNNLGKNYGEIAADARSCHKSQGFGTAKVRGSRMEYLKYLQGDSIKTDLDEVVTGFKHPALDTVQAMATKAHEFYKQHNYELTLQTLLNLKNYCANSPVNALLKYKANECTLIIQQLLGLWLEASSNQYSYVAADSIKIKIQAIVRNAQSVKINSIKLLYYAVTSGNANVALSKEYQDIYTTPLWDSTLNTTLTNNELLTINKNIKIENNIKTNSPYWLTQQKQNNFFTYLPNYAGVAENKASYQIQYSLLINNTPITITKPLVYKETDDVKGEVYRNVEILPPVTININAKSIVSINNKKTIAIATIKANTDNVNGTLYAKPTDGWLISIPNATFKLLAKNDEINIPIELQALSNNTAKLQLYAMANNINCNEAITRIEYEHIPYQFMLQQANTTLTNINIKIKKKNIAYIIGAGDEVGACLENIGYKVTYLKVAELGAVNLTKYDAVIAGVRAYNKYENLFNHHTKLMEYVQQGGTYLVQYNTTDLPANHKTKIGPYPFTISRDRVTDETATITLTNEKNKLVNKPNKITTLDFNNWVQERGLYYATAIDSNYITPFSMQDPNEKATLGSTIICNYGQGKFIYTGLAFFRQLPAGVPGAYRLFTNLINP
jgi:LmbE family N-acetylglucosaminyl deacetylase